jgi:hypothetical protein
MEARSQLRHRPTLATTSSILVDKVQFVKRPREASRGGNSAAKGGIALLGMNISRTSVSFHPRFFQLATILACISPLAAAQQAAPAPTPPSAPAISISTEDIRPEVDRIYLAVSGINVPKWKAPGEVKAQTQSDIASIQRNMKTTLPELLDAAKAAPGTVAPAFAVYRNVCALYDVLLRVAETATLAGPQQDGVLLDGELQKLDAAKKSLGASIFDAATSTDKEMVQLRASNTQLKEQIAAAQAPPKKVVVNDGPAPAAATPKKKKKPVAPATTTPPATAPATPPPAK